MRDYQEDFNTVAKHLFTQGSRSVGSWDSCQYRGKKGRKCAIGVLLSDDDYDPMFDNLGDTSVAHLSRHYKQFYQFSCNDGFYSQLQKAHDKTENWVGTESMKKALTEIAKAYNLDYSILKTLKFEVK